MIHSASSSPTPAPRNDALAASSGTASRPPQPPTDQVHIDKAAVLRTSLQQVPEIRPEVVERARALAADPAYPSDGIIKQISAAIVNSPDLSEDRS
jgi:hypothetical protein